MSLHDKIRQNKALVSQEMSKTYSYEYVYFRKIIKNICNLLKKLRECSKLLLYNKGG